jgi:hypothetical protein
MRKIIKFFFFSMVAVSSCGVLPALAGNEEIWGTYRLISATNHYLDTNETIDAYGKNPKGYITYGPEGRMMVFVTFDGRIKLDKPEDATSEQRAQLYSTTYSYAGTYTYTGTQIIHHIDMHSNESWAGRDVIRDISKHGDSLTYVTKPQTDPRNGRPVVVTLIWEKVK